MSTRRAHCISQPSGNDAAISPCHNMSVVTTNGSKQGERGTQSTHVLKFLLLWVRRRKLSTVGTHQCFGLKFAKKKVSDHIFLFYHPRNSLLLASHLQIGNLIPSRQHGSNNIVIMVFLLVGISHGNCFRNQGSWPLTGVDLYILYTQTTNHLQKKGRNDHISTWLYSHYRWDHAS